mmetsp:Transcript_2728/g.4951  ORF Transcript_2728/g.4951 Transcript_2728/m.4951 type:complete len:93 (-) Transcript_2728:302-580(-)
MDCRNIKETRTNKEKERKGESMKKTQKRTAKEVGVAWPVLSWHGACIPTSGLNCDLHGHVGVCSPIIASHSPFRWPGRRCHFTFPPSPQNGV